MLAVHCCRPAPGQRTDTARSRHGPSSAPTLYSAKYPVKANVRCEAVFRGCVWSDSAWANGGGDMAATWWTIRRASYTVESQAAFFFVLRDENL